MKKIEIIEYLPEHIEHIMETHPRKRELYWKHNGDWGKWAIRWKEEGPAYTLLINDEIVMCAGVIIFREGFGEAWMVLSQLFYKYPKECFKAVQDKLEEIISTWKLKRVQSLIMTDFPEGEHWVRHLGFGNETPDAMKSFGPNFEPMYMYAREIK